MLRSIIISLLFFFSTASSALVVQGYDVSKSWDNAVIYMPTTLFTKSVASASSSKQHPVIVFMHGCGGINDHEHKWAQFLKSQGFVVVMPDSLSIPNRVKNCDSKSYTPNVSNVPVNDLRPAEAEFAIQKVREQEWADKDNIFLMGHSEGGMAVGFSRHLDVNGIIISGWTCFRGVRSKPDTPLLVINWDRDPWFEKPDRPYSQCSDKPFWKNKTVAQEVILPGKGHATGYEETARNAVAKFLKDFRK